MSASKTIETVANVLTALAILVFLVLAVPRLLGTPSDSAESEPSLPVEPIALSAAATKGNSAASVTLIEYSDFECPYCARFTTETLPQLLDLYVDPGRVQLAFVHVPLERVHRTALNAAVVADCAGKQGRFWEAHDLLFQNAKSLASSGPEFVVAGLQMDRSSFNQCVVDFPVSRIRDGAAEARALGINSTPSFLVGVRLPDGRLRVIQRLRGARPLAEFRQALDRALNP